MPVPVPGEEIDLLADLTVTDATEQALEDARPRLTRSDMGAIATVRALARKIDAWDVIVQWARDDVAGKRGLEGRPVVPEHDNVTIPTYLKYCEALGLTPAARVKLPTPKEAKPVGRLQSIQGGVASARGKRSASGA